MKKDLPKGLPTKPGKYFVCIKNEQTNEYEWVETYFDHRNLDNIWQKAICWSYK